jgi:hypothetical protein
MIPTNKSPPEDLPSQATQKLITNYFMSPVPLLENPNVKYKSKTTLQSSNSNTTHPTHLKPHRQSLKQTQLP